MKKPLTSDDSEIPKVEARNGRFKKGVSGNPKGRPPGSRNKATLAMLEFLEGEGPSLMCRAVELAQAGNMVALKLCLERLLPPQKERPVVVDLPAIKSPEDVQAAYNKLFEAIAEGIISPAEAKLLSGLIDKQGEVVERAAMEQRLEDLEKHVFKK
jgi:hypothetical protein